MTDIGREVWRFPYGVFPTARIYRYTEVLEIAYLLLKKKENMDLFSNKTTTHKRMPGVAFYPTTSAVHQVSVLIYPRETQIMWSHTVSETEKKHKSRMNQGRRQIKC